jgi:hypothetical protein
MMNPEREEHPMNELLDLAIRFDEGDLDEREAIRFAALLLHTGMVNSTGTFGRFVAGMIDGGFADDIAADLDVLRADPLAVLGVS